MDVSSSSEEGPKDASGWRCKPGRFRLTKEDRVRRPFEYRKVTKCGVRYRTPHFHIRMFAGPQDRQRLGMAVSRKVGNAWERNGIKRRVREYFRLNRERIPPNTDIVFVALTGAADLDTHQLRRELNSFFEKVFGR
ncbi:MAG: ribonuclease P protein component [Pseudomonadota bacterium]